jgi:regulator of sigma E protease
VEIERGGERSELSVIPREIAADGGAIGRIGAGVQARDDLLEPYRVRVRYGPVEALVQSVDKTLDMSQLMLRVMGRMLLGQASVENLSGPITIAETAGRTAS